MTVKISVLIPCYNAENSIRRAITSVIEQTLPVTEILCYDDGSLDASRCILEELRGVDNRVQIFGDCTNKGAGHARKRLLEVASGDWVAFLDADDFWHEGKLEAQMQTALARECQIVVSGYRIVDAKGRTLGERAPPPTINYSRMLLSNWIPMSFSLISSRIAKPENMSTMRLRNDYLFWLKTLREYPTTRVGVIARSMGTYERRNSRLSGSVSRNLISNFRVFRLLGYGYFASSVFLLSNSLIRLTRL